MFNTCRASTIVVVLQLALGLAFYADTHSVLGSAAVVIGVTFLVHTGLSGNPVDDDLHAALLPAFFAPWAFVFGALDWQYGVFMSLAVAVTLSYYIATVGERYRSEPWPLVFIAALPLGIGTVLGGSVLLFLHLRDTANEPIA